MAGANHTSKSTFMRLFLRLLEFEYYVHAFNILAAWLVSFVTPVWPFIMLSTMLVLVDLYTGTRAAKKRGETLTSRGYKRTVEKIVLYFAAIILSEATWYVFKLPLDITYIAAFTICLSEIKSIFENIHTITGVNIWQNIVEGLKNAIPKK